MREKLRTFFFGPRPPEKHANPQPTRAQTDGDRGEDSAEEFVLLSQRSSDLKDVQGFREIYYCRNCRDHFILAWHSKSSPLVDQCEIIPDTHPCLCGRDSACVMVFCPQCQSDYAIYGPIQYPASPSKPEDARVFEAFDYPFPPDAPSWPEGTITLGSLIVEKVVMLVTGEFPKGLDVRDFAYDGFNTVVLSRHGDGFRVSEGAGIRLHVLRVNTIVDETAWLTPLLQREVYRTQSWGTKVFLTYGVCDLKPPLGQALFCLVVADS